MNTIWRRTIGTIGLLGMSSLAAAGEAKPAPPHEPLGFVAGGLIGAFAAGPVGAVVGAGLGTWLGNRVHRAGEAGKAEATVAALQVNGIQLQTERTTLLSDRNALIETNRSLSARFEELTHQLEEAHNNVKPDGSEVLDGLQGDVLFRSASAEITPQIAHQIEVLALAVAKSHDLKVRVDGYADPRGTVDANLKLSQARADAVRDLLLAAGIAAEALEVNAYGKSQSVAADVDGYALERRVRLTIQSQGAAVVAQAASSP